MVTLLDKQHHHRHDQLAEYINVVCGAESADASGEVLKVREEAKEVLGVPLCPTSLS